MDLVTLNCKSCGAGLPAPVGPVAVCEYCGASFAVSRKTNSGAASFASKEHPAELWLGTSRPPLELHLWLLDKLCSDPWVEPSLLHRLASERLKQNAELLWAFTAQAKGGFTAMVGIHEQRVMPRKVGNNLENELVRETRWTPFASQLRLTKTVFCGSGTSGSSLLAQAFAERYDPAEQLRAATDHVSVTRPVLSADESWSREAGPRIQQAQEEEARKIMQGDEFKNVKWNMEVTWQPALLSIETVQFEAGGMQISLACPDAEILPLTMIGSAPRDQTRASRRAALAQSSSSTSSRLVAFGALLVVALGASMCLTTMLHSAIAEINDIVALLCSAPVLWALAAAASWGIGFQRLVPLLQASHGGEKALAAFDAEVIADHQRAFETARESIKSLY